MNNFKHTPVPWYAVERLTQDASNEWIGTVDILNKPNYTHDDIKILGYAVPYGGERFPTVDEARANGKLFAAAPDMLQAIIQAVSKLDGFDYENPTGYDASLVAKVRAELETVIEKAIKQ